MCPADKIEVVEVDLGDNTPVLSNIRVTELPTSVGAVSDDSNPSTCTLMMNFDITLPCPDSRIVLRARVGGKT